MAMSLFWTSGKSSFSFMIFSAVKSEIVRWHQLSPWSVFDVGLDGNPASQTLHMRNGVT